MHYLFTNFCFIPLYNRRFFCCWSISFFQLFLFFVFFFFFFRSFSFFMFCGFFVFLFFKVPFFLAVFAFFFIILFVFTFFLIAIPFSKKLCTWFKCWVYFTQDFEKSLSVVFHSFNLLILANINFAIIT